MDSLFLLLYSCTERTPPATIWEIMFPTIESDIADEPVCGERTSKSGRNGRICCETRVIDSVGINKRHTLAAAAMILVAFVFAAEVYANDADDQYAVATGHYVREQWKLAVEEFQTFLKNFANDRRANQSVFLCGEAMLQLGKLEDARGNFQQYLRREPGGKYIRPALFRSGEAAYLAGNFVAAKPDLEGFLAKYPDDNLNAYVFAYLGDIAFNADADIAADTYFREGLKRFPNGPMQHDCRLGLARILLKQKRYDDAAAAARPIVDGAKGSVQADAQLVYGLALLALKRYADAVGPLDAFVRSNPSGETAAKALGALAVCHAKLGLLDKAKQYYADLVRNYAQHPVVLPTTEQLAETAYQANDAAWSAELSARLPTVGKSTEYQWKGKLGLAWSLYKQDKLIEAASAFDDVLKHNPPEVVAAEASMARGRILEKLGQDESALAIYDAIVLKHPSTKQHADALLAAARLREKLKQPAQAALLYQRFVKDHPQASNIDAVIYQWAWAVQEAGKPADAAQMFNRLRTEFPKSPYWADATCRLAQRAFAAGSYDESLKLLDQIVSIKPTNGTSADESAAIREHAMFLRGEALAAKGDWAKAREAFEAMLKEFPKTQRRLAAEFGIAEDLYRRGDRVAAARAFDRLAEQLPRNHEPWMAMIPLRQAQLLARQNQWVEAQAIAAKIASDFPNFDQQYEVDYLLGRCLANRADFDGARQAYGRVIRSPGGAKSETAAMAQWMIGETYLHQKKYETALREFSRLEILYAHPVWQAGALLQAGKCHELLGDAKSAVDQYQRILKSYGNTTFATEAAERLKKLGKASPAKQAS